MSAGIYRTMESNKEIKLTYLEKLFLSGSKWKKFLFHTIVIGKPIALITGFVLALVGGAGAIIGVLYLVWCGLEWCNNYIVGHAYLTQRQLTATILFGLFLLITTIVIVSQIKEQVKQNNERWARSLKDKLNSPLNANNDNNE